jgi:hypothetical protein
MADGEVAQSSSFRGDQRRVKVGRDEKMNPLLRITSSNPYIAAILNHEH